MTYDPIDEDADGAYDTNELTVDTLNGLDLNANVGEPLRVDGQTVFSAGLTLPASTLPEDLVAWYRFENGDGRDSASNARFPSINWGDGTAYDGTTPNLNFQSSGGVDDVIDGPSSQFARVPDLNNGDDVGIDLGTNLDLPLTFMAWIKADSVSDAARVLIDPGDGVGIALANGKYQAKVGGVVVSAGSLTSDFKHIAATITSTTGEMYINGSSVGTTSRSGNISGDMKYGDNHFSSQGGDDNGIDDLRFYNRVLSQSEISAIFNQTQP